MGNSIEIRQSPLVRFLTWARALKLVQANGEFNAGSDFGTDMATTPRTDPIDEMSAYSIAWIFIAVQTCANDLAALPRKVMRNGEEVEDHPFLNLIEQPRTTVSGLEYSRQRWADWFLSGNTYDYILRPAPGREPIGLHRLHPARCKHITARNGDLIAVEYDAQNEPIQYPIDDVLVCRDIAWERGPNGARGMSRIRALMRELSVDVKSLDMAMQAASRGTPAFHVGPNGDEIWSQEQVKKIADTIDKMLAKVGGGAIVTGGKTNVTPLGLSMRDMEYLGAREMTRQTILSAFRIPPTIAGLPGANFATADKEAESYWSARMADAEIRDACDSRLAAEMGQPGDYVVTGFSNVPALKMAMDHQIDRARKLWDMGVPAQAAFEFVGIEIEYEEEPTPEPPPPPPVVEEEPPPEEADRFFTLQPHHRAHPKTEAERAQAWRSWEDGVRGPAENRVRRNLALFLRAQGNRMADRARETLERSAADLPISQRAESEVAFILNASPELAALIDAIGGDIEEAGESALLSIARLLGVQVDSTETDRKVREALEASLGLVQATTNDVVAGIVRDGLADGLPPTEIARRITQARAFSPARALTVARTEVTKATNAAASEGIREAARQGVGVAAVEWLSSRDGLVRSQHSALDGKTRSVDGTFESEGHTSAYPGGFGTPHLDANCRCTVLPVLD